MRDIFTSPLHKKKMWLALKSTTRGGLILGLILRPVIFFEMMGVKKETMKIVKNSAED